MSARRVAAAALLLAIAVAATLAWGVRTRGWRLPGLTATASAPPALPGARARSSGVLLQGHSASVASLAFSADGTTLISGGGRGDGAVRLWDVAAGREVARFAGHGSACSVIAVALDATGALAVSAAGPDDFSLRVWQAASGGERRQLSGDVGLVFRALSPDATRALAQESGPDGRSRGFSIWDLATGRRLLSVAAPERVATAAFSPDGATILTGGENGSLNVWNAANGERMRAFAGHGPSAPVTLVAVSRALRLLVSAATDGTVVLWDPETGVPFRSIADATVFALADDGRTLAIAGVAPDIRVIDAISGREHARVRGHEGRVTALAFAPGGRRLASGGQDTTVRVWTIDSGEQDDGTE
jgi:WD40 repeat protein